MRGLPGFDSFGVATLERNRIQGLTSHLHGQDIEGFAIATTRLRHGIVGGGEGAAQYPHRLPLYGGGGTRIRGRHAAH